jgi:L-methionine (R)-S-oxide reductase
MMETRPHIQRWLEALLSDHGAVAGTVHLRAHEVLELEAAVGIPDKVRDLTRHIPKGKGMAGLAWERDAPVQTCNLQTDASGDVRPGARAVSAQASVAIPIHDAEGEVCGVVGLAFAEERELTVDEVARYREAAERMPRD